jgi:hypothetical protein
VALWLARGVAVIAALRPLRRSGSGPRAPGWRWLFRAAAAGFVAYTLGIAGAGTLRLYADPAYQRADYRAIAAHIARHARAGDAIVLNAPNQLEVFGYYYDGPWPVYSLPHGLGGDDAATEASTQDLIEQYERLFVVFWGEAERDPQRVVERTLDTRAFEASDTWYGDVRLVRYLTPDDMPDPVPSGAQFGAFITLHDYAISSTRVAAGDAVQIALTWETDTPLIDRYKVFVQLLNADGMLVAQRDSEPGGGLAITPVWQPGERVRDPHALLLPADLPAGQYTLIVGLYRLDPPHERLPVGTRDYLPIATITVTTR